MTHTLKIADCCANCISRRSDEKDLITTEYKILRSRCTSPPWDGPLIFFGHHYFLATLVNK